jgi:small subunit ribosomal protein S10e
MVAEDDKQLKEHPEVKDVGNLAVLKLMESLASRQLVRHRFAWKHHYWFLTTEGITYLREYLNLPDHIVPNTHKKQQSRAPPPRLGGGEDRGGFGGRGDRPSGPPREGGGFGRGGGGDRGGDRGGYRDRGGEGGGRKDPSSFGGERPSFGRGREGGGDRPPREGGGRPSFGRGAPPS